MEVKITLTIDDRIVNFFRGTFNKKNFVKLTLLMALTTTALLHGDTVVKPFNFSDGTVISAAQVNSNFDTLYSKVNQIDQKWTVNQTGMYSMSPIGLNGPPGNNTIKLTVTARGGHIGVLANSEQNAAVLGSSTESNGVQGQANGPNGMGVYGVNHTTGPYAYGVRGYASNGAGVYGQSSVGNGVQGFSLNGNAVVGRSNSGHAVYGRSTTGYSGYFDGMVYAQKYYGDGSTLSNMRAQGFTFQNHANCDVNNSAGLWACQFQCHDQCARQAGFSTGIMTGYSSPGSSGQIFCVCLR